MSTVTSVKTSSRKHSPIKSACLLQHITLSDITTSAIGQFVDLSCVFLGFSWFKRQCLFSVFHFEFWIVSR